ncbi:lactate/malate dehydrogenase family protein [Opitutales bacterium ASA1]|uniref:malate dehydrogenase n=1 Tax=Congregicoccus parvus TaxID=3081749 RepID=UPI002B312C08|nr:lactate/malate dehydrogenase family protein [Opitutales bacterium ASA1]
MKVAIIGGGGRVGSCAAYALQLGGIVREIILLDANKATAEGEALDLLHGSAYTADQVIRAGEYADCAAADLVCITAGLRRKPDESRLDLINRNVALFRDIVRQLNEAGLRKDAIVFVVSNPVDILTQLALDDTGLPKNQVIGLGTVLDTSRFCSLIADALELPPTQVRAMILGEHGDTMLPIWSSATVDGVPLTKFPGVTPAFQSQVFARTQKSGAEVISRKGGAGWAVGVGIAEVIHSIALDRRRVLPVSAHVSGLYGINGVCISVPTVVGRTGVIRQYELELWPKEMQGLQTSAKALREVLATVRGK